MNDEKDTGDLKQPPTAAENFANAMIKAGPARDQLFTALAIAQGELGPAMTNKYNDFFKHGYADLSACLNAMREPLSKNGLSLIQLPQPRQGKTVSLITILAHKSGQSIKSELSMEIAKDTPQEVGSVLTYLRRYAACAMVGIAQEDNDASEQNEVSDDQVDQLMQHADELFGKQANAQIARIVKLFNVNKIGDLLAGNFDAAVKNLNQIAAAEKKKAAAEKKATKPERESL